MLQAKEIIPRPPHGHPWDRLKRYTGEVVYSQNSTVKLKDIDIRFFDILAIYVGERLNIYVSNRYDDTDYRHVEAYEVLAEQEFFIKYRVVKDIYDIYEYTQQDLRKLKLMKLNNAER